MRRVNRVVGCVLWLGLSVGCASLNPLLPAEVEERGMEESPLRLGGLFSFEGTTVGGSSIAWLSRSSLSEGGVQHVQLGVTTPRGGWRVECAQEVQVEGTILRSVIFQGRVCHGTRSGEEAPAWTLALVGAEGAPWRGLLVDGVSVWSLDGAGLGDPDRTSPVVKVLSSGQLIGVWDEVAATPRLWLEPGMEDGLRERLEMLGLVMFAIDDLRDGYPDDGAGVYNLLDAVEVKAAEAPPAAAQVEALERHGAQLEAAGFKEGAGLLARQVARSRVERLDVGGLRAAERNGAAGRLVIEFQAGPLWGDGLGWSGPEVGPSGLGLQMGGGVRLSERTQLVLGMGLDLGPYSSAALASQSGVERGWSSAGFGLGLGLRWTVPLVGPAELTLGAQARGRLGLGDLTTQRGQEGEAPAPEAGFVQAGVGLSPLVGLQHATVWNDLGTRTIFFLEASPEWTAWFYGRVDPYDGGDARVQSALDALEPKLEEETFLLRVMLGLRLEL